MTTISVAFIIAFLVSGAMTWLTMPLARRLGFVDIPDDYRKHHGRPIPRLGGPAIFLAFFAPIFGLLLFRELSQVSRGLLVNYSRMLILGIGATVVLACGVLDDKFGLKPLVKLAWEIAVGTFMYLSGFTIGIISTPLGGALNLGIFALPITVLWFVGCMNAVNLLDGLDGLASGVAVFVGATLFLTSLHFQNSFGMFTMACLIGAALGFLLFNFPPAKIFLGDSGSLLLGFLIAALSLLGASRKAEAAVALLIPIVALGLPILDTLLAILRRWYKRLPFSTPDRQHIHHRLVSMGYSPRKAVLTLYLICVGLAVVALIITFARNEIILMMMAAMLITSFVGARIFSGLGLTDVWNRLRRSHAEGERLSRDFISIETALQAIRQARTLDDLWAAGVHLFEDVEFDSARLTWAGVEKNWRRAVAGTGDEWSVRLRLPPDGELRLGSGRAPGSIFGERSDLLEALRDTLAVRLAQLPAA
jgi:UDP-GlcNAc:undecaprenyl-phosphate GlcNAc-1-phosphate transferase